MIKMNIPVICQFLKDLSANNNREWFNAVSYTHLFAGNSPFKKDNILFFLLFCARLKNRFSFSSEGSSGIKSKDNETFLFSSNAVIAVSYTHLDVYKRQHPYHTHPPEYPDLLPSQAYPADN